MSVRAAHDILQRYWDGILPVNPAQIAQAAGVTVEADPNLGHSGHYSRNGGKPRIVYNSSEAVLRQRFTVAHELGHHVNGDENAPRDTREQFFASGRSHIEVAANKFAAALLMPASYVKHAVYREKIDSLEQLASIFQVSTAAMHYRLVNLGII